MNNTEKVKKSLKRRYAKEKRFQWYGRIAVFTGFVFLALLLLDIIGKAIPAFQATEIKLEIPMDRDALGLAQDSQSTEAVLSDINYAGLVKKSLRNLFPEVKKRKDKKQLYKLISSGAEFDIRAKVMSNPDLIGGDPLSIWVKADDDV
ncbi:MAG: DUF3333 domain-containing protein, partial [Gammaproteobacteria bacterium]|nr:DUF3333 domain-containing protein [Gammaproteobacteria bacterium]